jgi:hypothetical protein
MSLSFGSTADSRTEAHPHVWRHFPHCPSCHIRLWAATTYRHHRDPRGPLQLPRPDGTCPKCGHQLYTVPSAEADNMRQLIASMR